MAAKHDNKLIFEAFMKSRQKVVSEDSLDNAGGPNNDDQINKKREAVTGSNLSDDHSEPEYKVDGPKEEKREVAIGKEILNQVNKLQDTPPNDETYHSSIELIEKLATELIQMHEKVE